MIARYALERDLILVTNNMIDFERIYEEREFHPGLVFITATQNKLMKYQERMFDLALDAVEEDEPVQEAILITASPKRNSVQLTLERYYLPEVQAAQKAD